MLKYEKKLSWKKVTQQQKLSYQWLVRGNSKKYLHMGRLSKIANISAITKNTLTY